METKNTLRLPSPSPRPVSLTTLALPRDTRRLLRAARSLGGPPGAKAAAVARAALRSATGRPSDAAAAARVLEWVTAVPKVGVVGGAEAQGRRRQLLFGAPRAHWAFPHLPHLPHLPHPPSRPA
jgi:hypothetical protein